ncbi:MAG: aminomethyltransferase family protein [Clostridiales Family XIII bacterium]|jgi:aminomethyltransferase|nr:aminomethyltransferase family protein [Clostridiales Family XIII bacterium]
MKAGPFYFLHEKAGARMTKGAWGLAEGYADAKTEHFAVRNNVGMFDFSSLGNIDLKGGGVKETLQRVCVNDMNKLVPGKALYTTIVNPDGGTLDDTTVYMFDERHYMIVTSTARRFRTLRYVADHAAGKEVFITDITSGTGILCVQGPNSTPLLDKICKPAIGDIEYFFFKKVEIAGCDVLVSRTGYTGSRGYELFVGAEDSCDVWDAIIDAGREFKMQLCGTQVSLMSLPLEKGYISRREMNDSTNPYELGLGWTVVPDKDTPCVANEALKKIKERGPANTLVGFVAPGRPEAVVPGTPVFSDGEEIGKVTSAGFGWSVGKFIGMAYIKSEHAVFGCRMRLLPEKGTSVEVEIADKVFFDPEGKHL